MDIVPSEDLAKVLVKNRKEKKIRSPSEVIA